MVEYVEESREEPKSMKQPESLMDSGIPLPSKEATKQKIPDEHIPLLFR